MSLWRCASQHSQSCTVGEVVQRSASRDEHILVLVLLPAIVCSLSLVAVLVVSWQLQKPPPKRGSVVLTAEDRLLLGCEPPWRDGAELHRQVPMERWCVTREDLQQFRRLVQHCVQEGSIIPNERDLFDPMDWSIGPSVHTTTRQFIKPVTQAAGSASWALMKHPEGLPCDLFVTHAWQEGTYELIDKVLHSWPTQAHHAYICMLSNPQNLDISHLISTPLDSPFAKALRSAVHMLVVPNRKGSIYRRAWCAYEAYLGYAGGKLICTAGSPPERFGLRYVRSLLVWLLGHGVAYFVAFAGLAPTDVQAMANVAALPSAVCVVFSRSQPSSLRFLLAKQAGLLVGGMLGIGNVLITPLSSTAAVWQIALTLVWTIAGPWAAEEDTQHEVAFRQLSTQLQAGYTGHLRDAKCSVAADGEHIRREVKESGKEEAVDAAVKALICMGMSSPMLREVVLRAGIMGNVAKWSRIILVVVVLTWAAIPLEHYSFNYCKRAWLSWIAWAELLVWLFLFVWLPSDRRAFTVATLTPFGIALVVTIAEHASGTLSEGRCRTDFVLSFFAGPTVIALTLLGPAQTARLPVIGPLLVRLLLMAYCRKPLAFENEMGTQVAPTFQTEQLAAGRPEEAAASVTHCQGGISVQI